MACPVNPIEEDPQVGLRENTFEWGEQVPLSRDEVFGSIINLYNSFKTSVEGMMEELRLLHRSGSDTNANNGHLFSQMAERVAMVETLVEEKENEHQFMRLTAETQTHAQLARFETQLESLNADKAMLLSVSSRLENLERDVRADLEALKVEVATLQRQVGSLANLPTAMDVNTSQVAPDAGQLGDL